MARSMNLINYSNDEWVRFGELERLTSTLIAGGGVNVGDMRALYSIMSVDQTGECWKLEHTLIFNKCYFCRITSVWGS